MAESVKHAKQSAKADGADSTRVLPSDWNADHIVAVELTNNSGEQLVAGDVVRMDITQDESVVTTTTIANNLPVVVARATIDDQDPGDFIARGFATINVQGAVGIGEFLRTSATTKKAESVGAVSGFSTLPSGAFAIAWSAWAGPGAGTVTAYLFGVTYQPIGFKGPDIASASNLSFDRSAFYHHVTGTTTIDTIDNAGVGRLLLLEFDGVCQLTHSSNLILSGASNTQSSAGQVFLFVNEGSGVWREVSRSGSTGVILKTTTTNSVGASTASEQTLWTDTVPAGTLSTDRLLEIIAQVSLAVDGSSTLTIKLYYGTTVVATLVSATAGGLVSGSGILRCLIAAKGATNAQQSRMQLDISEDTLFIHGNTANFGSASSEDSTAAKTVKITVTYGLSSANNAAVLSTLHVVKH